MNRGDAVRKVNVTVMLISTYSTSLNFNKLSLSEKEHVLLMARKELADFHVRIHQAWGSNTDGQLPPGRYIFEIGYSTALILVHRPFLGKISSATAQLATETTFAASADVTKNINLYRKYYTFDTMPLYVIFHLTRAAIAQLFASLGARGAKRQPSTALKFCLAALEDMYATWPIRVRQAIQLIREVAARWKVTWVLPMQHSSKVLENNI